MDEMKQNDLDIGDGWIIDRYECYVSVAFYLRNYQRMKLNPLAYINIYEEGTIAFFIQPGMYSFDCLDKLSALIREVKKKYKRAIPKISKLKKERLKELKS